MKKAMKSLVAVIIALITVFSATASAFCVEALAESNNAAEILAKALEHQPVFDEAEKTADMPLLETQSLAVYDYLAEFLIENGYYDSGIYYIYGSTTLSNGMFLEFMIYYSTANGKIYFFSDVLEGKLYIYMAVDSDDTDSYSTISYSPELDYTMYGTVYPRNYPYFIDFVGEPNIYIGYDGAAVWAGLSNQAFQMSHPYWNALLSRDTALNMGNMGFARLYTPNPAPAKKTYTVSYDMNGGTGNIPSQTKEKNVDLTLSAYVPVKYGYKFLGWSTDKNATEPEYTSGGLYTVNRNITLYAVWERDESVIFYDSTVRIVNNPGSVTLNYKTVVYISAEAQNLPDGGYIKWFKNGQDTGITENQISFEGTDTVLLTVKAFDKDGNVLRNADGKEIADNENVVVNNGFFHRLIQAIRRLFLGVTTYNQ